MTLAEQFKSTVCTKDDIPDLIRHLKRVAIIDNTLDDWEHESTTWLLEDSSTITIDSYDEITTA